MDTAVVPLVAANAVRLQLHALAYNLGNFLRTLATPEPINDWSLTSLKEKLIKIGAKLVSHGRYVAFQMVAEGSPCADEVPMIRACQRPPIAALSAPRSRSSGGCRSTLSPRTWCSFACRNARAGRSFRSIKTEGVMRKLIMGIVDFRERLLPQYAERFHDLALTEKPDALFIT